MAFGRPPRSLSILQRARALRAAGPGRPLPPTRTRMGRGRARVEFLRRRRGARGGFFKDIFKGAAKVVKAVTKVPVVGAIAKAAVGSLPVVGQVVTAVNAFKKKTPVGVAASPIGGVQTVSGAPPISLAAPRAMNGGAAPRRRRKRKAAKRTKRAKAKRKGGGSAKQRAARARFAAAARKGRIKKGQRL